MGAIERAAQSAEEFGEVFANYYYRADSYGIDQNGPATTYELATFQAGIIPVGKFTGFSMGVRRGWKQIRQSPSPVYVIWFPLLGSLSVTQDHARDVHVGVNEMVVTFGDRPFHIKALSERQDHRCAQMHVLVPSHVMHTCLPEIDHLCGKPFQATQGAAAVARDLFASLFREAEAVDQRTAEQMCIAGLQALANVIRPESDCTLGLSSKDARLEMVLTFIRKNVSIAGLTVDDVVKGCNISRRYVHYLMKSYNQTFSEFLWQCRLEQAHLWLTSAEFANFNIVDIAYMAGFRSPSHFSQTYRAKYGCSPKEARKTPLLDIEERVIQ